MNLIDGLVRAINPVAALHREKARIELNYLKTIRNSGYEHSGASTVKKSMKGWTASSKSPQEDIDPHLNILRQRSRDLYMSAPLAVSAIKTKKTKEIGPGLKLKSRLEYQYLGITHEQATEWEKNTEREFELFAKSVWCDALRLHNFYELQPLARMSWLLNGDCFALVKNREPTPWMPYGIRIHLIEADRVSTPDARINAIASFLPARYNTTGKNKINNNTIYNGVEVDKNGAVVAYWICNQYPNSNINGKKKEWKRVEAFGEETGNPNILHLMEPERCEQYRGVPFLAPVIEELKQITRYQEAELMAALVQAFYTVFIEVDGPTNEIPYGEVIPAEQQVDQDDEASYEMGAGTVNMLGPGEKAVFADPKRPASGFEPFINTMAKMIGAALDVPYEVLMKSFNASYSASRAALLEAWKAIETSRSWFINDFCQPIYELWLAEAVARGRINAPGFFNDPAIRAAWSKAEWIGPTQGQIDPVKEVVAAKMRVEEGFSTREQETTAMTGGNWDDNIGQLKAENKYLQEINSDDGQTDNTSNEINTNIKNTIERSLIESE